jgi:hypothetical protein
MDMGYYNGKGNSLGMKKYSTIFVVRKIGFSGTNESTVSKGKF